MAQPDLLAVFYDGECPICRETIRRIKAKDRAGRIEAVDIKAPAFDRKRWGLPAEADLDGSIHALTQDGRVVAGMEVLRAPAGPPFDKRPRRRGSPSRAEEARR